MTAPQKRPYVRPRVGSTMLRSVWYLFAFAGVLAVALLLPGTPEVEISMEGSWELAADRMVADLPPGHYELLVTGNRYALHYEVSGPGGDISGMEMGRLVENDGAVLLEPDDAAYQDADGAWSQEPRQPRRLKVDFAGGRLRLTDDEGDALSGQASSDGAAPL